FVVFVLVGYQVIEGKAIVAGNEIDAIQWQTPSRLVEIRTPRYTGSDRANHSWISSDEAAHMVTIAPVPFGPAIARKTAYLIETHSIPGFNDEFCIGEHFS